MLGRALGIPPCFALGILEALWHTTAELAPSGNIGRLPNEAIAMEMFYEGDADALIAALVDSRHLEIHPTHRLIVHDWLQHSDYNTKRKVERRGESMIANDGSSPVMTRHKSIPVPEPVPEPVKKPSRAKAAGDEKPVDPRFATFKDSFFEHNRKTVQAEPSWGARQATVLSKYLAETPGITVEQWQRILDNRARSDIPQGEPLSGWIDRARTYWKEPLDRFGKPIPHEQPTPVRTSKSFEEFDRKRQEAINEAASP